MGIVIDREKALASPCLCYQIGPTTEPEDLMCFSSGIIGTLSDPQDRIYCEAKEIRPTTLEFSKHIQKFRILGSIMDVCAEKPLEEFLTCVEERARQLQ